MQSVINEVFLSNRHFNFTGVKDLGKLVGKLELELQELDSLYAEIEKEYEVSDKNNNLYLKLMRLSMLHLALKEKYDLLSVCLYGLVEERLQKIADTVIEIYPNILFRMDDFHFDLLGYLSSVEFVEFAYKYSNDDDIDLEKEEFTPKEYQDFSSMWLMHVYLTVMKPLIEEMVIRVDKAWEAYDASDDDDKLYKVAKDMDDDSALYIGKYDYVFDLYSGLLSERKTHIADAIYEIDKNIVKKMDSYDFNLFDYFCSYEYIDAVKKL